MLEEEIIIQATHELKHPTLGVTQQYLKIHQPVTNNGVIRVDRVDTEGEAGMAIVYIPIVGEYFHLAVYVDLVENSVTSIGTCKYPINRTV